MSDLLSLLQSASSAQDTSNMSQLDLMVSAYRKTEQPKINALNTKKQALQKRQSFFNTLNSKLTALIGNIDTFTASNAASKFITRSITSSDSTVLTATASSTANIGVNAVKVDRLATSDLLISDRMTLASATSLVPDTYSFTINGVTGNVTLTADDDTNEEVMQKLSTAINNTDNIGVTASYIKVDSTYGKFTLTSTDTGSSNDIDFTDSSVLTAFGITNAALNPHTATRTTATETTAGFKTANYSDLDAKVQINGVNIYRSSNTINDALTGITLNLVKPQSVDDQAVTMTTSVDRAAVENLIQPILNTYNDILKYLKQDSSVLRGDSAISSLYSKVRLIVSEEVTSANPNDPKFLTDIGIKIGSDGTLSINDHDRLLEVLQDDPEKVSNLFTTSDSFVAKLNSTISNLTGDDGLIPARTKSLSEQIDSTTKRTETIQKNIDKKADMLRKEYENILSLFYKAQSQYDFLGTFYGG